MKTKLIAILISMMVCFIAMFASAANKHKQITEEAAKQIMHEYIINHSDYKIDGYTSFTNLTDKTFYVFVLVKDENKYLMYVSPVGYTIGPSLVKHE
jgi:archaellum component FlaF (FlaF/FlaG flagellin family)